MKGTHVYLAGPMRGVPALNHPAFDAAAADLRERGYEVWSPAEHDRETGVDPERPLREYMQADLPALLRSDKVTVLPGWELSEGAQLEVRVAETCGIPVLAYPDLTPLAPAGHPGYLRLLSEIRELHAVKSGGYGTDADPFANYTAVASAKGQPRFVYPIDRSLEKITRCYSLIDQGRFDDLGEEFLDIASTFLCAESMRRDDKVAA